MEATYQASVYAPLGAHAMSITNVISTDLTIQTRLINQSQYDMVSANLHGPSGVVSINLSAPSPLPRHMVKHPLYQSLLERRRGVLNGFGGHWPVGELLKQLLWDVRQLS
jgi:hypothetical protein